MAGGIDPSLMAVARRYAHTPADAEDLLQQALLTALEAGRTDFASRQTRAWLAGVIRNKARMEARSAVRRHARETAWQADGPAHETAEALSLPDVSALPPSLRLVALLALSGATRPEIAWLLGLSDSTLRQRISQLKRALARRPQTDGRDALQGALPFGALRRSMVERLKRRGGFLASHDPDGHVFVLTRSQKSGLRQQDREQPDNRSMPCSHP